MVNLLYGLIVIVILGIYAMHSPQGYHSYMAAIWVVVYLAATSKD